MSETSFALRAVNGAYGELERASAGGLRQLASDAIGLFRSIKSDHPIPTIKDAIEQPEIFGSKNLPPVTIAEDSIVGFDAHLNPILSGNPAQLEKSAQTPRAMRSVLATWQRDEKRLALSSEVGLSDSGLAPQRFSVDHDLSIVRDWHGFNTLKASSPLPPDMHVLMGPGKTDITPWLNFNAGSALGRWSERFGHRPALSPDSTIHIQFDPTESRDGFVRTIQLQTPKRLDG
jgi:hypothetical protein